MSYARIEYEISQHGSHPSKAEVAGRGSTLQDAFETALSSLSDKDIVHIAQAAQAVLESRRLRK